MFHNIPQVHNIIWDANISLRVIYLSPFIGTFILWDVDNLLLRLISEEHRQSMVDSANKFINPGHILWVYSSSQSEMINNISVSYNIMKTYLG